MQQTAIFWPVLILMLWTFLVLVQVPIRRFAAAFKGRVVAADFRYGESAGVPVDVALPNRVFMNLLEVPVLFYVMCILFYITGRVDGWVLAISWTYLLLRLLHSLIYLTYNRVFHRFLVFAISNLLVLALVIYFAWLLAGR